MKEFFARVEVPDGEVEEILTELRAATETISACYDRLRRLGILTLKEKGASDN